MCVAFRGGYPPLGGGTCVFSHNLLAVKFKTHNLAIHTYYFVGVFSVRNAMAETFFF